MDLSKHLQRIDEAIDELLAFHSRTADPAEMPHQYIGTVIDNTAALLCVPANSIDEGCRRIVFSEASNWVSAMQAVHRSFFSTLLIATERGLAHLCDAWRLPIQNRKKQEMLATVDRIETNLTEQGVSDRDLLRLKKHFESYHPVFTDYLETAMASTTLSKMRKKEWRKFFRALSIIRNKLSHSDVSLTAIEIKDLIDGGCEVAVSKDGSLGLNPRMYAQAADFTLVFFEELYTSRTATTI